MNSQERLEEELFEKSLELPSEERECFIRNSCSNDPELAESVLGLLRSHDAAGDFMKSSPAWESTHVASRLESIAPTEERPGDQIGRYRLLEIIGEGAWGTVWIARQTEDIDRQVAIKILKVGLDTKDFLARFEAERQTLAMMDHPNIARVIDAGATERGRPFLVMELVKGIPILEFADKNRLSVSKRVELFIKVCRAMFHAHHKGVVHRDLKPSNILVSDQYDEVLPKVIDFGVAKSSHSGLTDKTLFTNMHSFIGTPIYSSPEQLEFAGKDVDARSDIYSLGSLLYELLCGKEPFDCEQLSKEGLAVFRQRVHEEDPTRPSQRFGKLPEADQTRIAAKRKSEPGKLESRLKNDLDWIAMKCLEKDPGRRYESAGQMADDLQACLNGASVSAAAPGFFYRIRKFILRKRPAYAIWAEAPAVLFGILALFFYFRSVSTNSEVVFTENSIAVLPLQNLSSDPDKAFFPDGIHEELIAKLSNSSELLVLPRTYMLPYRETQKTPHQIANELGVRYLVTGSARQYENKKLVDLQLIEAETGRRHWSGQFERELADPIEIQKSIAKEAADQITQALLSEQSIAIIPFRNLSPDRREDDEERLPRE